MVSFEVPDSSLVDCGTVSTGSRYFPEGTLPYIFGIKQWKNSGIPFAKIGQNFFLYYILTIYLKIF
jgi:hypothetical protein